VASPEGKASNLACQTDDPAVWAALLRVAQRAEVAFRIELLRRLGGDGGAHRSERLAFLARFLDDDAVPDVTRYPEKWRGWWTGFGLRDVGVRDFAAMAIATILGMNTKHYRSWPHGMDRAPPRREASARPTGARRWHGTLIRLDQDTVGSPKASVRTPQRQARSPESHARSIESLAR
jgi:hypothetical protein